jgi:hypothetical protein
MTGLDRYGLTMLNILVPIQKTLFPPFPLSAEGEERVNERSDVRVSQSRSGHWR